MELAQALVCLSVGLTEMGMNNQFLFGANLKLPLITLSFCWL